MAEPRIVLENSNAFTVDAVTFSGGVDGDCIIQIPQVGRATVRYSVIVRLSDSNVDCRLDGGFRLVSIRRFDDKISCSRLYTSYIHCARS